MAQYLHILQEGCAMRANNDGSGHDNEEGDDWEERMTDALENLMDLVIGIDNARGKGYSWGCSRCTQLFLYVCAPHISDCRY